MNIFIHFLLLLFGIATVCLGSVQFVLLALFSVHPLYAIYSVIQMYLSVWFSMRMAQHLR